MVQDVVFFLRLGDHLKFPFKDQWNILFLRSFPVFYQHPPKSANFLHTTGYDHDGQTGQHKPKGILPAVVSAVSSTETDGPSHLCSSMQMNNLSVAYLGHHLYEKNYHSAKKPVPTATHIATCSRQGCELYLLTYLCTALYSWNIPPAHSSLENSLLCSFSLSRDLIQTCSLFPRSWFLYSLSTPCYEPSFKVMTSSNKREL